MIHYKNPLLVLGCVPQWEGKMPLCRRAIQPRLGFWTVPAGFMENGETMQAAAARECYEKALARVQVGSPARGGQRHARGPGSVMFRAALLAPEFAPGPESLEVGLYDEADIPWERLAFPSGEFTLRRLFRRSRRGPRGPSFHRADAAAQGVRAPGEPCATPRLWQNSGCHRAGPRAGCFDQHGSFRRVSHGVRGHRKLHQVQIHGLRGSLSGGLLSRAAPTFW